MATTVHIPPVLLRTVDRRAKALGISRNRLIVRALERAVKDPERWSPEFLDRLRNVDAETAAAAGDMLDEIRKARRSKRPQDL